MGVEDLTRYLQRTHSAPETFLAILQSEQPGESRQGAFWSRLDSEENPHRTADLTNLPLLNEMAGEKGFAHMWRICEAEKLDFLLTSETTGHSLALSLFLDHPDIFDEAYTTFHLDYLEGWQVYAGKDISEYVDNLDVARKQFQQELFKKLKKQGLGDAMQVDVYVKPERLILDIKYAGQLIRQEDFDHSGQLQVRTARKPLEMGLAYYPSSGLLKVKTPRGLDLLNRTIYEAFARAYLKQPDALLTLNADHRIHLDEFKVREDFPTLAEEEIRGVKVTGVTLTPWRGSSSRLILRDTSGALKVLPRYSIVLFHAVLHMIAIQFEFEGKGRSRFRTVTMTDKNRIDTNNSARDAVIETCLKRWGVLHGCG